MKLKINAKISQEADIWRLGGTDEPLTKMKGPGGKGNAFIFSYIIPKPCSTNPYAIDFGSIKSYPKSFKIDDTDRFSFYEASFYISGNFSNDPFVGSSVVLF